MFSVDHVSSTSEAEEHVTTWGGAENKMGNLKLWISSLISM